MAAPISALLPRPVRRFVRTESAGAIVLLASTLIALGWANSPWHHAYETLLHTNFEVSAGGWALRLDLHQVVNDALMTLFFFVVGLEIKRELTDGELSDRRNAILPALAAGGGMIVPAGVFIAITLSHGGAQGWGIPMATDIAFALGLIAAFGSRLPDGLRVFMLALAVVDDIGAIIVIAVFYSASINLVALAAALLLLGLVVVLRQRRITQIPVYAIIGVGVWLATYLSGVHATIAGVALGLLTPATALTGGQIAREWADDLDDEPSASEVRAMTQLARSSVSVAERLQYRIHPLTSFVVIPLFALTNAGVRITADALSAPGGAVVAVGVVAGLVIGKTAGISAFTWLGVKLGVGTLPADLTWGHLVGAATVGGIGFTVSLFVADLAFTNDPTLQSPARIGVLAGSALAASVGAVVLWAASRRAHIPTSRPAHDGDGVEVDGDAPPMKRSGSDTAGTAHHPIPTPFEDDPRIVRVHFEAMTLGGLADVLGDVLDRLGADAAVILDLDRVRSERSADTVGAVTAIAQALRATTERGLIIVISTPDESLRMELNRRDIDRIAPVRFSLDDARVIVDRMISI